jgi:hypothetical protein
MAFQSVPLTYEIDTNWNYQGSPIQMGFFARVGAGAYGLASAQALAAAMGTFVAASFIDSLGVDTVLENVTVRGLQNENDVVVIDDTEAGAAGVMTNTNPSNVAFAFKRVSGLTGRSARGRVFWPVPSAARNVSADNFVTSTWATTTVGLLNLIQDALVAAVPTAQEVIVSRYANGEKRPVGITFDITNWTYSDLRVDTMKGRLPD